MQGTALALMLACVGTGAVEKGDFGEDKRDRPFSDQVDVEINGAKGRIRMPRTMLFLGGFREWADLRRLRITDRAIDGLASTNIFDMPRVRIDRVTGTITITSEEGNFSGQCEVIDASAPRKF